MAQRRSAWGSPGYPAARRRPRRRRRRGRARSDRGAPARRGAPAVGRRAGAGAQHASLVTAVDSDEGDDSPCRRRSATNSRRWPPRPPRTSTPSRCGRPACWRRPRWSVGCGRSCVRPPRPWPRLARPCRRAVGPTDGSGCARCDTAQWHATTDSRPRGRCGTPRTRRHAVPVDLQTLTDCPLRWLLERHGGRTAATYGRRSGPSCTRWLSNRRAEAQMLGELERCGRRFPSTPVVRGERAGHGTGRC